MGVTFRTHALLLLRYSFDWLWCTLSRFGMKNASAVMYVLKIVLDPFRPFFKGLEVEDWQKR